MAMPVETIARPLQKSNLLRGHSSACLTPPRDYGDYARQDYLTDDDFYNFMEAMADNTNEESATCLSSYF